MGVYDKLQEMPTIWDSDSWCIQMDITLSCWLLVHSYVGSGTKSMMVTSSSSSSESVDNVVCETIRDMFANYYFAAAFWKFNSHFMNPNGSCATMFVVQIIVNYIRPVLEWIPSSVVSPHDTLISIATFAKSIAPASTLIVEFSVGGLMVLGSLMPVPDGRNRFNLQSMGSLSALAFHLMVCFVPAPNDISGFALNCAPRHIVFASVSGTSAAVDCIRQYIFPVSVSVAVGVAIGVQNQWTENNWAFFLYVYVASFVAMSILFNKKISTGSSTKTNNKPSLLVMGSSRRSFLLFFWHI